MSVPRGRLRPGLLVVSGFVVATSLAGTLAWGHTVDTNRPGFSFTPGIVPAGRLQLESGVAYDRSSRAAAAPLAEFRYGLGGDLELFAASVGWVDEAFVDVIVGAKQALAGTPSLQMAVLVQLSLPLGADRISSGSWDPSAGFIWARTIGLPLAGTAKISRSGNQVRLDNSLKLILPSHGAQSAFVEWEMNFPEGGRDSHWLNGGSQWLLSNLLQLDLNVGVGLNDAAGDYRVGLGISRLF